jgi:hypothetical protein
MLILTLTIRAMFRHVDGYKQRSQDVDSLSMDVSMWIHVSGSLDKLYLNLESRYTRYQNQLRLDSRAHSCIQGKMGYAGSSSSPS